MSRLIDADALKRKAQRVATESWKMRLTARIETTLNQFIDWIDNAPTVQPEPSEITDEQAILHLQSTGWMQNHDREIYESGLKEQLADDSESYDSLIPYEDDEDTISRLAAIDALDIAIERYGEIAEKYRKKADIERNDYMDMRDNAYEAQQLAQWLNELKYLREKIEQIIIKPEQRWIPCSERLPKKMGYYLTSNEYKVVHEDYYWGSGCFEKAKKYQCEVVAWMPMPIPPYCGGNGE